MPTLKRTYAMPRETVERFERAVGAGKRSKTIDRLVRSWLDEQERARLRAQVIEGCREMADVLEETEREYHSLEEEVERGNGEQPA